MAKCTTDECNLNGSYKGKCVSHGEKPNQHECSTNGILIKKVEAEEVGILINGTRGALNSQETSDLELAKSSIRDRKIAAALKLKALIESRRQTRDSE